MADTEILRPTSDGDQNDWSPRVCADCPGHGDCDDGGTNWGNVDDVTPDDTCTYINSGTSGHVDLFNIEDSGVGAGTISKVRVHMRYALAGPGDGILRALTKVGVTLAESTDLTTSGTQWVYYDTYYDFENSPDGDAWTWTDIDNLQIGVENNSGFPPIEMVTQVYAEVYYTAVHPPNTPTSDEISPHQTGVYIYLIWLLGDVMASKIANNFSLGSGDTIEYKSNLSDSWSTYTVGVSPDVSITDGTYLRVSPSVIENTFISINTTLDVYVTHPDATPMTVSFYWSDDTLIKELVDVASGSVAKTDALSLDYDTSYDYYILIDDGATSPVRVDKSFTTMLESKGYASGLNPGAMAKMMDVV